MALDFAARVTPRGGAEMSFNRAAVRAVAALKLTGKKTKRVSDIEQAIREAQRKWLKGRALKGGR